MKSLQILICSIFQAKHLVITREKDEGLMMFLSYLLQQNVSVELHIIEMLKQFLCNWARLAQPADLIILISPLLMGAPAIAIN